MFGLGSDRNSEKFMKMKLAVLSGIAAAMFAGASVQANTITGTIEMGGEANLSANTLDGSMSVASWPLVYVAADSGSFGSIFPMTQVTMSTTPWVFYPEPGVTLNDLWSVGNFTFDFISDSVTQSGNFLSITGSGTISGNGYDLTDFDWNLSFEEPTTGGPMQFTFSAAAQPSPEVPDGGLTLALLGVAFAGVEIFRRKLSRA
jgi:hypothetical protein